MIGKTGLEYVLNANFQFIDQLKFLLSIKKIANNYKKNYIQNCRE